MPDPTFKIDSTTVMSKSGTTVSVDSGLNIKPAFSALDSSATNGPTSGTAVTKSTTLPLFGCRAWVNFNGESVDGSNNCAIRASGNVSSVLKNGTGDYTITFTTAMPDTNYATFVTIANYGTAAVHIDSDTSYTPTLYSTTQVRVAMGAAFDSEVINVMVIR